MTQETTSGAAECCAHKKAVHIPHSSSVESHGEFTSTTWTAARCLGCMAEAYDELAEFAARPWWKRILTVKWPDLGYFHAWREPSR